MPKLFDWSGKKDDPFGFKTSGIFDDVIKNHKEPVVTQNVNLDEKQREKLEKKHCVACIFSELRRAGFTHDYGNTRCFNAAKYAIKELGHKANPNRLCQFAMDYLIKERDADAVETWFEEIRL